MAAYPAARQELMTRSADLVFLGSAPMLGAVAGAYGRNVAVGWVECQLVNLSEFAGCRDKLTTGQLDELASLIVGGYPWLRLTEVMLFFRWFKTARYGRFYGVVDPLVIMNALGEFADERTHFLADAERRAESLRHERELAEHAALVECYHGRVPEADRGLVDLMQFRLMGYAAMDDATFAAELAALRSGLRKLPSDIGALLALIAGDSTPNNPCLP